MADRTDTTRKHVTLSLPADLVDELDTAARARCVGRGLLIEMLLTQGLRRLTSPEQFLFGSPETTPADNEGFSDQPRYRHRCWVPDCERCDAEAGHDALVALLAAERQRTSQLDEELQRARAEMDILVPFARWAAGYFDRPCEFDHHGYCQAHGLDQICPVGPIQEWLTAHPDPPESSS